MNIEEAKIKKAKAEMEIARILENIELATPPVNNPPNISLKLVHAVVICATFVAEVSTVLPALAISLSMIFATALAISPVFSISLRM